VPRRDLELLRRYLSVLAVNTAGIAAEATLWSTAGINAKTAQAYQALFQRMFVLDLVPAWFSNRIKRLVKAPKRYLVDPALVTAVLGLGRDALSCTAPTCWAAATVTASDARHLTWLRDQTGDAFAAGIVLHTGPHVFPISDRIVAAPVSTLWS
jgi:hypothetical protein